MIMNDNHATIQQFDKMIQEEKSLMQADADEVNRTTQKAWQTQNRNKINAAVG
jgi:hypothetical protein